MKKALLLTWEKYQDVELLYAYYRLKEEFEVDVAANKVGFIVGINGVKIKANVLIDSTGLIKSDSSGYAATHISVLEYDLLVVVGGLLSVEKARQDSTFIQCVRDFGNSGKTLASICHGAQYLISAGLTKNKRISGYYSIKDDITNSGATFVDEPYVIDGNIISCPHYDHQSTWMKAVVKRTHEYVA